VPALSHDWEKWVVENLAAGVSRRYLVTTLAEGLESDPGRVEPLLDELERGAAFEFATSVHRRLERLTSMLDVLEQVRCMADEGEQVTRVPAAAGPRTFVDHYHANRPLMIEGLGAPWSAVENWTPSRLKARFGGEPVEVMTRREEDRDYEVYSQRHRSMLTFGDYIDQVERSGKSNDIYLVANNRLLERPGFAELRDEVTLDERYVDPSRADGNVFLWLGPAGTITPLHYDLQNVMFVQVFGRKRFTLVSPYQSPLLYNSIGVYSDVDVGNPDLAVHHMFKHAHTQSVVLAPGDALLLPVGWWHHVEAIDVSISVSFTNFWLPNSFDWARCGRSPTTSSAVQ